MTTVHLVRHAKAKNRLGWEEPDHLRPLTKRGRHEAAALAQRLAADPPDRLVSSPYARCVQTLEPLALVLGLPIETTDALAEGADGRAALQLLLGMARGGSVACCTHGDVVYEVVDTIGGSGVLLAGPRDVRVASVWELDVQDERVVAARFVDRPSA